jgi:hypothetical protein
MPNSDSPELDEEPLVVGRAVYGEEMKLEAEVKAGAQGSSIESARGKIEACATAGDRDGVMLWNAVFQFLKDMERADSGTKTIALEER